MPATCVNPYSQNGATGVIGHYTQVVWAESYAVGCGYVYFNDGPWYTKVIAMHISISVSKCAFNFRSISSHGLSRNELFPFAGIDVQLWTRRKYDGRFYV